MELLFIQLETAAVDIVLLVIAIAINMLLAMAVYRSDPKSATNRIFALLTLSTICWLVVISVVRIPGFAEEPLYLHRLAIFFAAPMSMLFFLLAHTFPSQKLLLGRGAFAATLAGTGIMMILNISPYAFVAGPGAGAQLEPGIGLIPFSVLSSLFSMLAVYFLLKKYLSATGVVKRQLQHVLGGMLTMLALIIGTILVPIILFNSLVFLPFASLYSLAFLGATAFAITKYRLFNVKVLLTQVLTITICIILFAKLFGEESDAARLLDGLILLFMTVFGFFLVRSVRREIEQRELIEAQRKALEYANAQQENLLHFISHEIKGYLTKNEAAFAAIAEGDYGQVPPALTDMATSALKDTRRGVLTVKDILDASNLKKGTVAFEKKHFDFARDVEDSVRELTSSAEEKGLSLTYAADSNFNYGVLGDEKHIKEHVIRNIIDNSIRYTPKGGVDVQLTKSGQWVRLSVIDTGIGITDEDKEKLFTAGGHGKDSIKVNVHSTGYGLFIAKSIVEAHGGKIWADSEGSGKGSRFVMELPSAE